MSKCERTEADAGRPADWDPCRYTTVSQRQGNVIVTRKHCVACGHEIEEKKPVDPADVVSDPNNQFDESKRKK